MLALANKLTLSTQPTYRFVNKYSIDFDGVDDRIITDDADTVAQPTTYSFWCKSSVTGVNRSVFGHGGVSLGGFQLNNSGNHYRDFTSINDINHIIEKLCMKKINKNHIFNICSNRPIFIKKLIKIIEKYKGKLKIKNIPKNKADVYKTHGDNKKILNFLKLKKFSKFENDLKKTIEWFNKKNIIQLF